MAGMAGDVPQQEIPEAGAGGYVEQTDKTEQARQTEHEDPLRPTYPALSQRDVERLFESQVLARARRYAHAGRVRDLANIAEGLWHARVEGSVPYSVDVRILHSRVVSAGCSCPDGQRRTYCKHVGAVLLTMAEAARIEQRTTVFPQEASHELWWYWHNSGHRPDVRLSEDEWRAVRMLLERLYGLPDLAAYMRMNRDGRHSWQEPDIPLSKEQKKRHKHRTRRRSMSGADVERLEDLPHGWLTVLEAAYEHLHDVEGLRLLYAMYILGARDDADARYVPRLRALAGSHWADDVALIEHWATDGSGACMSRDDNPAYERLLREEHLVDAAKCYCMLHSGEVRRLRLLDMLVEGEPEDSIDRLLGFLRQPDSAVYLGDAEQSARLVGAWLDRISEVLGSARSADLAAWIADMFPNREFLQARLRAYLESADSATHEEAHDE